VLLRSKKITIALRKPETRKDATSAHQGDDPHCPSLQLDDYV
jgi:hypothetical protein